MKDDGKNMKRKSIERFLLLSAIPYKDEKNVDRLSDAIWRAHRDVLTGRFHLPEYIKQSKDVLKELYKIIKDKSRMKEFLGSEVLISSLKKIFTIEFGAVQKLVNMTLKYIIILNEYEKLSINLDESLCDCPLDSFILEKKLGIFDKKWTKINENEYKDIQNIIKGRIKEKHGDDVGNILFDFENWGLPQK